jgi:protein TonB
MRESTRRGWVLLFTVMVHGLIIYELATRIVIVTIPTRQPPVQLTMFDKPRKVPDDIKLPAPQMTRVRSDPVSISYEPARIPADPLPAPNLAPELSAHADLVSAASNGIGVASATSGTAVAGGNGATRGISVLRRVQPLYPLVSARLREQGDVVVAVLIDELGHVSSAEVAQSSGFRRLDQSVVDAIRRWTFTPLGDGSRPMRARTKIAWSFRLDQSNLAPSLTLIPFDAAVEAQIQAAAVPRDGTQLESPSGENSLRRLIARIRESAPWSGPKTPRTMMQLLARLGDVRSIQFLGIESHGIVVDGEEQVPNPDDRKSHHWELYAVEQQGGKSEWLIDVTRQGVISTAQAMTCVSPCREF